jgi:RNase P/RNase MRP subunit p29
MATRFLLPGTKLTFKGIAYTVVATNPANYKITRDSDGKGFNLRRTSPGIVIEGQAATTAPVPVSSPAPSTAFKVGDSIRIHAPRSPKWHGLVGTITKVNPKRYVTKINGRTVTVPKSMAVLNIEVNDPQRFEADFIAQGV